MLFSFSRFSMIFHDAGNPANKVKGHFCRPYFMVHGVYQIRVISGYQRHSLN